MAIYHILEYMLSPLRWTHFNHLPVFIWSVIRIKLETFIIPTNKY